MSLPRARVPDATPAFLSAPRADIGRLDARFAA